MVDLPLTDSYDGTTTRLVAMIVVQANLAQSRQTHLISTRSVSLTRLDPRRDESRPLLAAKRHILCQIVRSAHEVPPDVIHVTLVLHEKERSHLTYETRIYMLVAPADFTKFIVV